MISKRRAKDLFPLKSRHAIDFRRKLLRLAVAYAGSLISFGRHLFFIGSLLSISFCLKTEASSSQIKAPNILELRRKLFDQLLSCVADPQRPLTPTDRDLRFKTYLNASSSRERILVEQALRLKSHENDPNKSSPLAPPIKEKRHQEIMFLIQKGRWPTAKDLTASQTQENSLKDETSLLRTWGTTLSIEYSNRSKIKYEKIEWLENTCPPLLDHSSLSLFQDDPAFCPTLKNQGTSEDLFLALYTLGVCYTFVIP